MKNHQTVVVLEKALADTYALVVKTQNYHWNVVGENFKPLHELFGVQYEEMFGAIDEVAERIRAIGYKVEGSFENFQKLSKSKSANKNLDAKAMVKDLIADHESLVQDLKNGIKISQAEEDEATADLFIGRIQIHEKAIWMLRSSF